MNQVESSTYLKVINDLHKDGKLHLPVYNYLEDYIERVSRLQEFAGRVNALLQETDLDQREGFSDFLHKVVSLDNQTRKLQGQTVTSGYYGEADTNFTKTLMIAGNMSDEQSWQIKMELFSDEIYGLGMYILRHADELNNYLEGYTCPFIKESPNTLQIAKDYEYMIVGAWNQGGEVMKEILTQKANSKGFRTEWNCPNTRQILLAHNLIANLN